MKRWNFTAVIDGVVEAETQEEVEEAVVDLVDGTLSVRMELSWSEEEE